MKYIIVSRNRIENEKWLLSHERYFSSRAKYKFMTSSGTSEFVKPESY